MCNKHYLRWWSGTTVEDRPIYSECQHDGCDRPPRSKHATWCEAHYHRNRRTGTTERIKSDQHHPCANRECDRRAESKGYCKRCRERVRQHGDPRTTIDRRTDSPGYSAMHMRLRADLGPASQHPCVDCGRAARHWSYNHDDPHHIVAAEGPYSLSPDHYAPRCVPCHKRHDIAASRYRPPDPHPGLLP